MTADIFNDIKLALVAGHLPLNKTIHGLVKTIRELSPRHERDNDHDDVIEDLISHCYMKYIRDQWLVKYEKDRCTWGYYITKMVYYTLLDYRKSLIRRNSYYDDPAPDRLPEQEMTGVTDDDYFMYKAEGYEMDTPEDYLDYTILYNSMVECFGKEVSDMLKDGYTIKEMADKLQYSYTYFTIKLKKDLMCFVNELRELGYNDDIISEFIEKKFK